MQSQREDRGRASHGPGRFADRELLPRHQREYLAIALTQLVPRCPEPRVLALGVGERRALARERMAGGVLASLRSMGTQDNVASHAVEPREGIARHRVEAAPR